MASNDSPRKNNQKLKIYSIIRIVAFKRSLDWWRYFNF